MITILMILMTILMLILMRSKKHLVSLVSLFGDDYDPDVDDLTILMRSNKHLVTTESKLDWEESLPGPVSLALLNLQRMLTFFWLFF